MIPFDEDVDEIVLIYILIERKQKSRRKRSTFVTSVKENEMKSCFQEDTSFREKQDIMNSEDKQFSSHVYRCPGNSGLEVQEPQEKFNNELL